MSVHRRIPALIACLLLSFVSSTAPAAAAPGEADTRVGTQSVVPSEPERVRWRVRLQGDYSVNSPGVGSDGTIYVNMMAGLLHAIAPTGEIRWAIRPGVAAGFGPVSVGPGDAIYVEAMIPSGTGNSGAIFRINPDGTVRWSFDAGDFLLAGPSVGPDGNVYAVSGIRGIGLFSLTPEGRLRFSTGTFHERGVTGQEITFANDRLFFAFDMNTLGPPRLFGYDLDGGLRFQVQNPANGTQTATGPNGNVVLPTFPIGVGLSVGAFNGNGTSLWHFYEFPGNVQSPVDIGPDNTSYSSRNLSTLLALDAAGGVRWRYVDPGILFEPAVTRTGSAVFVPGRVTYGQPGFFLGVSPAGQPRWRVELPDEPGFEPYGQLVPMSRPVFSANSDTAYVVTDVAGDGNVDDPFAYLYAIDVTTAGGGPPAVPPGVPAAPSALAASSVASRRVDLAWTDSSTNETGFRIERCRGRFCTAFSVIGQAGTNVTTYRDTGVSPNTRYRYRVRAWNPAGSSGSSNVVTVRTPR